MSRFAQDCPSMTVHSHPRPLTRREGLGALRGSGREEGTLRTGLSILAPLPSTPSVPQHCKAMPGKAGLETLAPEPVMGEQKQLLLSQPPLPTAPLSPISSPQLTVLCPLTLTPLKHSLYPHCVQIPQPSQTTAQLLILLPCCIVLHAAQKI